MQLRTLLLVLVLALIAIFAAVNWSASTAPTTLLLVFSTVEAPLGLIMLAATAVLLGDETQQHEQRNRREYVLPNMLIVGKYVRSSVYLAGAGPAETDARGTFRCGAAYPLQGCSLALLVQSHASA